MGIEEIRHAESLTERILFVGGTYGATRAGVFGSLVRGEMRPRSDVDILVEIPVAIGLFEFVGLKQELEATLGRKVDLVQYETIKQRVRERVLAEEVPIL